MDRDFAESLAFMIWADIYDAATPCVGSGLPDGGHLGFTDSLIVRYPGAMDKPNIARSVDAIPLDWLAHEDREAEARKLAAWLGDLLGGESGIQWSDSGWSAWATREDGKVLEVAAFGYQLYESKDGFLAGGRCQAALRAKAPPGVGVEGRESSFG
ncbi:MAG: hypothetical protein KJ067_01825 [Vicinamibacteria bacterium]|nr:hypothetical protein [Vicinamibacteria bacterium]